MTPLAIAPLIRIESYHCYRLTLDLKIPPVTGALIMEGDHFRRAYPLPSAGEPRGFGMKPGNDRSLVLWTTNPVGAQVRLTLIGVNEPGVVGGYELREIDPRSLPVEVDGLLPLSGLVRAGEAAWLETPRRFIPGYAATVDERPARVAESPDHSVMVEVPAGEHQFNLRYRSQEHTSELQSPCNLVCR